MGDIDLKHLDIGTKRMLETMKIGKFLMKYAVCDVKIYTGKIYLHYKIDFSWTQSKNILITCISYKIY